MAMLVFWHHVFSKPWCRFSIMVGCGVRKWDGANNVGLHMLPCLTSNCTWALVSCYVTSNSLALAHSLDVSLIDEFHLHCHRFWTRHCLKPLQCDSYKWGGVRWGGANNIPLRFHTWCYAVWTAPAGCLFLNQNHCLLFFATNVKRQNA